MTTAVPKNNLKSSQSLPEASSGKINMWQKQVDDGDDTEDANNIHDDIYADDDADGDDDDDNDDDDDDDNHDDGSGGQIRGRAKRGWRI